ncbi:MAG: hypothetical protein ACI4F7_10150 [Acutalibacteraceae bacterium]
MEEKEIIKPKSGGLFGMIITGAIVTAVILLSVLTVKYFFKGTYSSLKNWYSANICAETDVNEVIETAGGGTDEV